MILLHQRESRADLQKFSTPELLEICRKAADLFANSSLPLGDARQTPEDYIRQVSATTGLPFALARKNLNKIQGVMAQMEKVLNGMTRHLDFEILDRGVRRTEWHGTQLLCENELTRSGSAQ